MEPRTVFANLSLLPWECFRRTYGNSHATYIGLLVSWWLSLSPRHSALDSGPTYAYTKRGTGSWGACDAVFCENDSPVGILEVEGLRYMEVIRKIGDYFRSDREQFATLSFGIIVFYTTGATGRGAKRHIAQALRPEFMTAALETSQATPAKGMILVDIAKRYDRGAKGARTLSEYYFSSINQISGILLLDGRQVEQAVFLNAV